MRERALLAAAALAVAVPAGTTAPSMPANCERPARETAVSAHTSSLDDFARVEARLTGGGSDGERVLCVLVADTTERRGRGLMDVVADDLVDPDGTVTDGMVFVWTEPTRSQFYMWQTVIPLTIAFFDHDGAWVAGADMAPCRASSANGCERYASPVPYCLALEVSQGSLDGVLGPGAVLEVGETGQAATGERCESIQVPSTGLDSKLVISA